MKDKINVLLYGDSISKGIVFDSVKKRYVFLEDCYAALLSRSLTGEVINCGQFGATVRHAIKKLPQKIRDKQADIVVLEFGGNDCDYNWKEVGKSPGEPHQPNVSICEFKQTMHSMIDMVRSEGRTPLLCTLPPIDAQRYYSFIVAGNRDQEEGIGRWLQDINRIYRNQEVYSMAVWDIAKQTDTAVVDVRSAFLQEEITGNYLCEDGIHPNEAGHRLIFSAVMEWIGNNRMFLEKLTAKC